MGLCVFFPSFVFLLENIPSNTKTHGNLFSKGVICVYIYVCGGGCPEKPEKGIGCPGSGAAGQLCASLGPGNQSWVLGKSSS